MVNWQEFCSCRRERPRNAQRLRQFAAALVAALGSACGHAQDQSEATATTAVPLHASDASGARYRCVPAREGELRGRFQGAINAEIDWGSGQPQCLGGQRPEGNGVRLVYQGSVPGEGNLLIVLGAGPLRAGQSARNVPVNLTIVREGTGEFFATQGDDKCAFDEVLQTLAGPEAGTYRFEARGYCTQPARAVAGDRSVLLSRFDVVALVRADEGATMHAGTTERRP
jgi:hypothetical protein